MIIRPRLAIKNLALNDFIFWFKCVFQVFHVTPISHTKSSWEPAESSWLLVKKHQQLDIDDLKGDSISIIIVSIINSFYDHLYYHDHHLLLSNSL